MDIYSSRDKAKKKKTNKKKVILTLLLLLLCIFLDVSHKNFHLLPTAQRNRQEKKNIYIKIAASSRDGCKIGITQDTM